MLIDCFNAASPWGYKHSSYAARVILATRFRVAGTIGLTLTTNFYRSQRWIAYCMPVTASAEQVWYLSAQSSTGRGSDNGRGCRTTITAPKGALRVHRGARRPAAGATQGLCDGLPAWHGAAYCRSPCLFSISNA